MSQYFLKPFRSRENIKITVDLPNYATKADIKDITHVDTSNFALKRNSANLKTEADKLDIENLVPIPANLSKLSYVVKNEVIKNTEYNKLVTNVNNIGTSDFVLKTNYNTKITKLENKISDTSNLVKKTDYNTKIVELENKIPDISNLVKKTDFKDGALNCYVFQPLFKYLEVAHVGNITYILSRKSRGSHDTKVKAIAINNYLLHPQIDIYDMGKIRIKFNGSFLNRFSPTMPHRNVVNIYIVYEITSDYKDINYPTLENCLFGSVKLTKNANIDKYEYFGYGIGFDRQSSLSIGNETGKNVIIFGVD